MVYLLLECYAEEWWLEGDTWLSDKPNWNESAHAMRVEQAEYQLLLLYSLTNQNKKGPVSYYDSLYL